MFTCSDIQKMHTLIPHFSTVFDSFTSLLATASFSFSEILRKVSALFNTKRCSRRFLDSLFFARRASACSL